MENVEEIWKPVSQFPDYEVSNIGSVRRKPSHIITKNGVRKFWEGGIIKSCVIRGYLRVRLCKNGKVSSKVIHRLVAQAHISNLENKPHVNHIDNDPINNRADNLEWCTAIENIQHAAKQGRMRHGESHPKFKHSDETIKIIKDRYSNGDISQHNLAEIYNIPQSMISDWVRNKNRKSISAAPVSNPYTGRTKVETKNRR